VGRPDGQEAVGRGVGYGHVENRGGRASSRRYAARALDHYVERAVWRKGGTRVVLAAARTRVGDARWRQCPLLAGRGRARWSEVALEIDHHVGRARTVEEAHLSRVADLDDDQVGHGPSRGPIEVRGKRLEGSGGIDGEVA